MYKNYTVRVILNKGVTAKEYILPHVFGISDPKEGMKATVITGTRGDGSLVIPGGKKSQEISIKGKLWHDDGYKDLTTLISEMKTLITTDLSTLTLEHYDPDLSGGGAWVSDWSYSVRRIEEIRFPENLRTAIQEYEVLFFVIAY
jgi:hypothetical protein